MSRQLTVASDRVLTWSDLPQMCCRHGEVTGLTYPSVTLSTRTPPWLYVATAAAVAVFFVLAPMVMMVPLAIAAVFQLVQRRELKVPHFPVCQSCRANRRKDLIIGWVCLLTVLPLGWLLFSQALVIDRPWPWFVPIALLLAVPSVGAYFAVKSSWPAIVAARLDDRGDVEFLEADAAFVVERRTEPGPVTA